MADVFILEGEEMNKEWLHSAQRHKMGTRTSVLEDDGGVCLSAGGSQRPSSWPLYIYIPCEENWVPRSQTVIVTVYHNLKKQFDTERMRQLLVHQNSRFSCTCKNGSTVFAYCSWKWTASVKVPLHTLISSTGL